MDSRSASGWVLEVVEQAPGIAGQVGRVERHLLLRTDWGGSSMRILPVSEDYEPTVGEMIRYRRAADGQQPGDPARAEDHH